MKKFLFILLGGLLFLIGGTVALAQRTDNPSSKLNRTNVACIKTAIDKREVAVQSAFDVFYNSLRSALQTRKATLLTAWDITDNKQKRAAIKEAWKNFTTASKTTRKTLNDTRKTAWKQFNTDRKACNAPQTGENPGADNF